jgi:hypothetical protein
MNLRLTSAICRKREGGAASDSENNWGGGGGLLPSETNEWFLCRFIASLSYPRASLHRCVAHLHISHPLAVLQNSAGTQNSEPTESCGFSPKFCQKTARLVKTGGFYKTRTHLGTLS